MAGKIPTKQWLYEDPKGGKLFNPRSYNATSQGLNFTKEQTEYQLFPEEYFTAADCAVYFNDVWMDELTGLTFTLEEKVMPVFSYANKTFDYVLRGKRIVQGQFRMAFKEAGYLFTILEHLGKQKKKSPAIGYLMKGEKVPTWHGQIQQNIEEILSFWNEQGYQMPDKTVTDKIPHKKSEKWLYKWPLTMKMWIKDSSGGKMNTGEKRHGYTTAVKQLQARLLEIKGLKWPPIKFNWKKHYSGDVWRVSTAGSRKKSVTVPKAVFTWHGNKIGRNSGDWYMCRRFNNSAATLGGGAYDAYSTWEAEAQKRMDNYPGNLEGFNMGGKNGKYDGRFGPRITKGLKYFLKLAEYDDGSNGMWVSTWMKTELQKGLAVTGVYDVPTKIAVLAFQAKNGLKQTGYVDYATMYALAPMHDVTYYTYKDRVVKGQMHYDLGATAEPRMTQYEKEIWGRPFVTDAERVRAGESFFYRGEIDDDGKYTTEWLYQNGIDIYINYGPLAENLINKYGQAPTMVNKKGHWYDGSKKDIGYNMNFNTTVKAIRNCQIFKVEQVLDPNTGNPIEEIYHFYAKDLD